MKRDENLGFVCFWEKFRDFRSAFPLSIFRSVLKFPFPLKKNFSVEFRSVDYGKSFVRLQMDGTQKFRIRLFRSGTCWKVPELKKPNRRHLYLWCHNWCRGLIVLKFSTFICGRFYIHQLFNRLFFVKKKNYAE